MNRYPSPLYSRRLPTDIEQQLAAAVEAGCRRRGGEKIQLFFRADDIGVPSQKFTRLITTFQKHDMPLCLAVVPSWLTTARLAKLTTITEATESLWCWHQHGRLHKNFEAEGKKQEFGPARSREELSHHLNAGCTRLTRLFGNRFQPFFTPPWNRCSKEAAIVMKEAGFQAISRSRGAKPDLGGIIHDIPVNVDLHTRKEQAPETGLANLLTELENSLASGRCGVMIHHQRMRNTDFSLLCTLLDILKRKPEISPCLFGDLL